MTREAEIAWLAGLLEGEGSFCCAVRANRRTGLRVEVKMTDKDVIEHAARTFRGAHKVGRRLDTRQPQFSDTYRTGWCGAPAAEVMMAVLPYMGERRSAKIRECLATPNLSHTPRAASGTKTGRMSCAAPNLSHPRKIGDSNY